MFGRLLGPRSFDSLKGPLAYKQAFFPIAFGDIDFIWTTTIALIIYSRNWAFVASIIVDRFKGDQCPFLLEALTRVDNNLFFFQQHVKAACDLLPPPAWACLPPFEQFIGQQMVHFQDSISKCLHHHTLSNMLFNKIFETHCVQILSCFGLGAGVLVYNSINFPSLSIIFPILFHSASNMTWSTTSFNYRYPLMYVHTSHRCYKCHFLCCAHGNEHIGTHDEVCDTFSTIAQDANFHVGRN